MRIEEHQIYMGELRCSMNFKCLIEVSRDARGTPLTYIISRLMMGDINYTHLSKVTTILCYNAE